ARRDLPSFPTRRSSDLATSQLPPGKFDPVGLSFVGASLSSAGTMEALEHGFKKDHPLRSLFLVDRPGAARPEWTHNMLLRHGVRSEEHTSELQSRSDLV